MEVRAHKESWFLRRIGRRIFRLNVGTCTCPSCKGVENHGLVVSSDQHARYLFNVQNELHYFYGDRKPVLFCKGEKGGSKHGTL